MKDQSEVPRSALSAQALLYSFSQLLRLTDCLLAEFIM
jgi:hypothetical protein